MGNNLALRRIERRDVEKGALAASSRSGSSSINSIELKTEWTRVLHKVPLLLREKRKHMYDPSVVSLGPYHHGATHLLELEHFKDEVVNDMLKADNARAAFRGKILERMEEIRHFYGGVSRDRYDDNALAGMMLRDTCFLLYCVELYAAEQGDREARFMLLFRHLGIFQGSLMVSDCFKLENQIPWWILKSLVSLTYDDDDEKELLRRFLSLKTCGNFAELKHLPWETDDDDDDHH